MPRQRPPSPTPAYTLPRIAAQFFICGFIGFLGKLTISEHGGHGGHGTQFGKARSICVRLLNYLLMPVEWERESGSEGGKVGQEALPVKCKGAISRMFDGPNLAFVICVYVCVSAPLWIRIQIEVTNLNWPQNWLPLPLSLPRPWPLCCRLAKSDRKQGLATCLCTQPLPPYLPLCFNCAAFSVVLCALFALHTLCNTGRRPIP